MALTSTPSVRSPLLRRRARAQERGAAVFIVMFAIVLLSGLGIWSMQTASLVDQASGYSRAAMQTQYTAELGVQAGTAYLSVPGWASANYRSALAKPDSCNATLALSLRLSRNPFCKSIHMKEISTITSRPEQGQRPILDNGEQGSLGPTISSAANSLEGDFVLEMTDPEPAIVPGTNLARPLYYRVTLTSQGYVRPGTGNKTICETPIQNSAAGRLGMRAHAIIGPI